MQRLLVLFPAIAVDAQGATWQNAFSDTSGHHWFRLAVTILPFVPLRLLGLRSTHSASSFVRNTDRVDRSRAVARGVAPRRLDAHPGDRSTSISGRRRSAEYGRAGRMMECVVARATQRSQLKLVVQPIID
jgi:hypothetical protein